MISDEKFSKKEHILKSKDFRKAYKSGLSRKNNPVILYYLPNGLGYSRIGFSISARNVKSARSRNRIRRIIREIYRKTKSRLKPGFDLVWIVKSDFGGKISYSGIEPVFQKLVKEAKILA